MRVALRYTPWLDKSDYQQSFSFKPMPARSWFFLLDPEDKLPIDTEFHFPHGKGQLIDFVVTRLDAFPIEKILCLQVSVCESTNLSQDEFVAYIENNWVSWDDITKK